MTTIYRVQDSVGRGPWKPGFSHLWVEDRDDFDHLIPWTKEFPSVLKRFLTGMHLGCGCIDKAQLKRWFTVREYRRLLALGYHSVEIGDCHLLAESEIQCVFQRMKPLKTGAKAFALYLPEEFPVDDSKVRE